MKKNRLRFSMNTAWVYAIIGNLSPNQFQDQPFMWIYFNISYLDAWQY